MQIKYSLVPDDIYQFAKFNQFRSVPLRLAFALHLLTWGFVAFVVMVVYSRVPWSIVILATCTASTIGAGVTYWNWRSNLFKRYPGASLRFLERSVRIDADGLHDVTPVSDVFYSWKAFVEIAQSRSQIYLFVGRSEAVIVPRRAFAGEEPARQFFETAMAYWKAI